MSNKKVSMAISRVDNTAPQVSWGYAYVMQEHSIDYIIGKILTIIDAMGLKDSQEKSAKDLIRQVVREKFNNAIYITPERNNEIHEDYYKIKKEIGDSNTPMGAI